MVPHTLQLLNALRMQNGQSPLKSWKESKAKLEAAIVTLQTKLGAQLEPPRPLTKREAEREALAMLTANAKITVCPEPAAVVARKKRDAAIDKVVERRLNGVEVVAIERTEAVAKPFEAPLKKHKLATGQFSLADICREINLDPKLGRARLRRNPVATSLGKYVYDDAGREQVLKVLRK